MLAEIQGHNDPWHPRILALPMARIDFILENHARRNPEKYTFVRGDGPKPTSQQVDAAWAGVLGNATAVKTIVGLSNSIAKAKENKERRNNMKHGADFKMTRNGKPI